ncbi:ANTAR domain-containing protein [Catellatospora sp. KI3]|uniref:ANTAR domain-containing protein n=1 Tax=Catellatospora sp. KI3 TaxID=3041620 RepID=UPI002482FCB7|nr:ANTAR domain-containing protein [Catellatospora sp. KI3]MDI1460708.1 ANTAR domain-containing protein [Catellatospora sp. KI3]
MTREPERADGAGAWEAAADERERLADERELLADERELLADARDRLADRHDVALDRQERQSAHVPADHGTAAARAAVARAEQSLLRAQAQLRRAKAASARAEAQLSRTAAGEQRSRASALADAETDAGERAWSRERRGFVAAEREQLARRRDELADARDEDAALREGQADQRERNALRWERRLAAGPSPREGRLASAAGGDRGRPGRAQAPTRPPEQGRTGEGQADGGWTPESYGPLLLASFAELARLLVRSDNLDEILPHVLKQTVEVVAGCTCAAVTLWRDERATAPVATDPVAAELDETAFGTGVGPGPQALSSAQPLYAPRLATDRRWPALAATAGQLGVASVLSVGLCTRQPGQWTPVGALTLYGGTEDAFSPQDRELVDILAAYLAVAVTLTGRHEEVERREAALHRALSSRDVIGQAKGILMERQRLSAADAFDVLRHASQRLNRRLVDVAQHLADTGELPAPTD